MKTILLVAALVAVAAAELISPKLPRHRLSPRHGGAKDVPFNSRLDHFNPRDGRTVNFTYVLKEDYFVRDGPIYIYIQEPDGLTTEFLETGLMHDLAIENGAALATANPRFFRNNIPTEDASVEHLQFLTVDQTINDIAYMIEDVRTNLQDIGALGSRVILFGSGYGASIATWTKQKFPQLIYGVWSSSGVYEQSVHSEVPLENLSNIIRRVGGDECANNLNEAYIQTSELMNRRQHYLLKNNFNTCFEPFSNDENDVALFFGGITRLLTDYVNNFNAEGIHHMCTDLSNKNISSDYPEFEAYGQWVRHVYTETFCFDVSFDSRFYEASIDDWSFIEYLSWNPNFINMLYPVPSRPHLWLRCTQLGGHRTTVNAESIFDHTIGQDAFFEYCSNVFGEEYDYNRLAGAVANLNLLNGGRTPGVSNVIYTNGDLDLMSFAGVGNPYQNTLETYVFNIENYGKSADLFSINPSVDTPELIETKEYIKQIITLWGDVEYHK